LLRQLTVVPGSPFVPVGMRTKMPEGTTTINTCSDNDTAGIGDTNHWTWANPTNRAIAHRYAGIQAVSVEALWQGTKIRQLGAVPDPAILNGNWRLGKGKRPLGAWAGTGQPLITNPGDARRAIYLPAYQDLVLFWLDNSPQVKRWLLQTLESHHPVFLRDFDTGQGIDRNGPMSHAWLLSTWLNDPQWRAQYLPE
jgi:hypothetical protein